MKYGLVLCIDLSIDPEGCESIQIMRTVGGVSWKTRAEVTVKLKWIFFCFQLPLLSILDLLTKISCVSYSLLFLTACITRGVSFRSISLLFGKFSK